MKDKLTTVVLVIAAAASLATSGTRTPQLERFADVEAVNIADDDWEPHLFQVHVRVPQHGLSADQFTGGGLTFEARLDSHSTGAALAKVITAPGEVERGSFTRVEPDLQPENSVTAPFDLRCADGICAFDATVAVQRASAGTILIGGTVIARVSWDGDVSPETDTPLTHELEITVER